MVFLISRVFIFFAVFFAGLLVSPQVLAKETKTKATLTARDIFRKTASQWSGDIFVLPKYGNYMLEAKDFNPKSWQSSTVHGRLIPAHPKSAHGIAHDYDLRIPIVFYDPQGRWFKPGQYDQSAVQQDIVPTLAKILDVPVPAKKPGRVLVESMVQKTTPGRPKAIVIFVQDQGGRQYFAAQPGRAPFYESMMAKGVNYRNGSVAHVDVETSVGHAAIGTGAWPGEHGVTGNNFWHAGIWRQLAALGIQTDSSEESRRANPSFFFTPALSDVWSVSRNNKPVILSVAPVARASISMGGHGALFNGGVKTYVTWLDGESKDGSWVTEEPNYQLPEAFKNKPILQYVKDLADARNSWRGHELISAEGKLKHSVVIATPALVRQQLALTRTAIKDLKIGADEETDLVWINTKSTDYCGHSFGFESEECGDVLAVADEEAKKTIDLVSQQTGGDYLVVLTADHGAGPMPELIGSRRLDRAKLRAEMNARFDKKSNNIDLVQLVTASQIYVNHGELAMNGAQMKDLVTFLKEYKAKLEPPYNMLADEWIKKGKPREALFFEDVVAKDSL
jgi:hypothetical protein